MLSVIFKKKKKMNEVLVNKIAKVIEEWNPLGEKANSIEGLEGYRYEAMDVISSSKILSNISKRKRIYL